MERIGPKWTEAICGQYRKAGLRLRKQHDSSAARRQSARLKPKPANWAYRCVMSEPCKVEIAYTDGHWFADFSPRGDETMDCGSLLLLIKEAQNAKPDETLLFVVDQSTIQGHADAEAQFFNASEKSGAMVISSVQEF